MSTHRVLIITSLVFLLACARESATPTVGVIPQGLGGDAKRCLDVQINQILENHAAADDLKAVRDGFDAATKGCSLNEQQKTQYLAYTNVLAGVVPDSVGDDLFAELKTVVSLQTYRRGTIQERFTNGWVVVRWDADSFGSTVKENETSPEVRSRCGVSSMVEVIGMPNGRKAIAQEVYASGVALIRWYGETYGSMVKVSDLSPRVECLNLLCTLSDVIHNTTLRRGYLTAVYANAVATVRWNGDSYDSTVKLSEVSGRAPH